MSVLPMVLALSGSVAAVVQVAAAWIKHVIEYNKCPKLPEPTQRDHFEASNAMRQREFHSCGCPQSLKRCSQQGWCVPKQHIDDQHVSYDQDGINIETRRVVLIDLVTLGQIEQVAKMIERGCNVNVQTDLGYSPLLEAVNRNDLDIAQMLLKAGANPNLSDKFGDTPISCAIECKYDEMVKLLVSYSKS